MKRNIIIFSFLLSAGLLPSCTGDHATKPGQDSTGHNIATNPYRDTFKTTSTYGNAATEDNSGSGGANVAKPLQATAAPAAAAVDTAKK